MRPDQWQAFAISIVTVIAVTGAGGALANRLARSRFAKGLVVLVCFALYVVLVIYLPGRFHTSSPVLFGLRASLLGLSLGVGYALFRQRAPAASF